MKLAKTSIIIFVTSIFFLGVYIPFAKPATRPEGKKIQEEVIDQKELQKLINTLENPKKREELIHTLKTLQAAQREIEKKQKSHEFDLQSYFKKVTSVVQNILDQVRKTPSDFVNRITSSLNSRDFLWNMVILLFSCIFSLLISKHLRSKAKVISGVQNFRAIIIRDVFVEISDVLFIYIIYNLLWYFLKSQASPYGVLSFFISIYLVYTVFAKSLDVFSVRLTAMNSLKSFPEEKVTTATFKLKKVVRVFLLYIFLKNLQQILIMDSGYLFPVLWLVLIYLGIRFGSFVNFLSAAIVDFLQQKDKHGYLPLVPIGKTSFKLYVWFWVFEEISNTFFTHSNVHLLITKTLLVGIWIVIVYYAIKWLANKLINSKTYSSWSKDIEANVAANILKTVKNIIFMFIAIICCFYVAEEWVEFFGSQISQILERPLIAKCSQSIIILALVVVVFKLSGFLSYFVVESLFSRADEQRRRRVKTIMPIFENGIKIGAVFVGGVLILNRLGVDVGPILAGAGIVGLAVGFGAQTLVKDLINGLFIIFENSFQVGDVIEIGGKSGRVEGINIRTTRLRDLDGNLHIIPNSQIENIKNMTKEYSMAVVDVGVAYKEDIDEVIKVLEGIGQEMLEDLHWGKDILEPMEVLGLDRFEDSQVVIRVRFKTRPIRQWAVKREFHRRVKRRFDELGIEIPFPHLTVYMGQPKKDKGPLLKAIPKEGEDAN